MKLLPFFCGPLALLILICLLSACKKEYSGEGHPLVIAGGTLRDTTTWDCMQDSVAGTFYGGVKPGPDTAYISVKVNVAKPGAYTIYTNTVNGYYFTSSGYFTVIGLNTVKLQPVGTPVTAKVANTFNVTFDTSICNFTVNVQDSTGISGVPVTAGDGAVPGSWRFTAPSKTIHGYDAVAVLTSANGKNELDVSGYAAGGDTTFSLKLLLASFEVPSSGQFKTDNPNTTFFLADYNGIIYQADSASVPDIVIFNIKSYNAVTKELKAAFSGTSKSPLATGIAILNGSFDAVVQ